MLSLLFEFVPPIAETVAGRVAVAGTKIGTNDGANVRIDPFACFDADTV